MGSAKHELIRVYSLQLRIIHLVQYLQRLPDLHNPVLKHPLTKGSGADGAAKETETCTSDRDLRRQRGMGSITVPGNVEERLASVEVEASDSIIWSAAEMSPGEPTRVPSSRYQAFKAKVGTSTLIRSMIGWRVKTNPSGPRRSPCCTPQQLRIESLPR